jgi:ribosome-associated protein
MSDNAHQDIPSKTQRKRFMLELQELGQKLVELPATKLDQLDLPEKLHEAILEARRITAHGGERRQLQYIGRLMRDVDPTPIQSQLQRWNAGHAEETALLHRLENWRQRLIEDDAALQHLLEQHPQLDIQQLRTLIRNARKEAQMGKPPRSSRALFRLLREVFQPS